MLEFLPSADDVIAFTIRGKLGADDLESLVERVEASLAARDKTHLFMEVEAFAGFDAAAFARYLPRGMAMLGKLPRFGRIAVVSDQGWIRAWTRIESALLPGIAYELFTPGERNLALAWVEGRADRPHGPALRVIETDSEDVIGFELDGKLGADEVEAAAALFETATRRDRPLRILGRIRHIGGIEAKALLSRDYIAMKLHALHKVERYALVGGPVWLRAWVGLVAPLVKMEMRHFAPEEEAQAWAWLGATPRTERALAA